MANGDFDYIKQAQQFAEFMKKNNTDDLLNSDEGKKFVYQLSRLRDKYEVDKIYNSVKPQDRQKSYYEWATKRYAPYLNDVLSNYGQDAYFKAVRGLVGEAMRWGDTYKGQLSSTPFYVIVEDKDGNLDYVPNEGRTDDRPRTTGEFAQEWAARKQNELGKNVSTDAILDRVAEERNSDEAYASGGRTSMLGEILAPRSYRMLDDDEFKSKVGSATSAVTGDVLEFGSAMIPYTGWLSKLSRLKKFANTPIAKAFNAGVDKLNDMSRTNKATRIFGNVVGGAAENTADNALAGAVSQVLLPSSDVRLADSPSSWAINAAFGGVGGLFGKSAKTKDEVKKEIWDKITSSNPDKTGKDWMNNFVNPKTGRVYESYKDIPDEDVQLWLNKIGGDEYFNKPFEAFEGETGHFDQSFRPEERRLWLDTREYDPQKQMESEAWLDRQNRKAEQKYQQRVAKVNAENAEKEFRSQYVIPREENREAMENMLREEARNNAAKAELMNEGRDNFTNALDEYVANGENPATLAKLREAGDDYVSVMEMPAGDAEFKPVTKTQPTMKPLPEKPKSISYSSVGDPAASVWKKRGKSILSGDDSKITDAEWEAVCKRDWKKFNGEFSSWQDMYANGSEYRDVYSTFFENGAPKVEYTYRTDLGEDIPVYKKDRSGNVVNAKMSSEQYGMWSDRSEPLAQTRGTISKYDQNSKFNPANEKDRAKAAMMRVMHKLDNPAKQEAFDKALREYAMKKRYKSALANHSEKDTPTKMNRRIARWLIPTIGREVSSPYHYSDLTGLGSIYNIEATDPYYK